MVYTSLENAKIKELRKLKQRKYREKQKQFLIDGKHLVQEAYNAGCLDAIIVLEDMNYDSLFPNVDVMIVTSEIMKVLSDVETSPNIMGLCHKPELSTGKNGENRDKIELSTKLSTLSTVHGVDRKCGRIRQDKTSVLYNS